MPRAHSLIWHTLLTPAASPAIAKAVREFWLVKYKIWDLHLQLARESGRYQAYYLKWRCEYGARAMWRHALSPSQPSEDLHLVDQDQDQDQDQLKTSGPTEALCQIRRCVNPRPKIIQQLEIDVRQAHEAGATEPMALADALTNKGYTVKVRRSLGSVTSLRCLQNLRHTFLTCSCEGHERPVIVDPHFREQFEVAKPTSEYASIVAELPAVFVGTEDEIELLVHVLCSELQRAFKEQGLPPWRSAVSMLSKWKPRSSIDILPTRRDQNIAALPAENEGPGIREPPGLIQGTLPAAAPAVHIHAVEGDCSMLNKVSSAPGGDAKDAHNQQRSCSLPRVQLYGFIPQSRKVFPCES